jgi:hypothetical protein
LVLESNLSSSPRLKSIPYPFLVTEGKGRQLAYFKEPNLAYLYAVWSRCALCPADEHGHDRVHHPAAGVREDLARRIGIDPAEALNDD